MLASTLDRDNCATHFVPEAPEDAVLRIQFNQPAGNRTLSMH
jgi:hypothetical protein